MNVPKNIKRFWMWVGIALLVELAAFTLWKRWYWFFPTHAVSEVYTRYADTDGLNVVFFKDYKINDTVFVDVTFLEATTDSAWLLLQDEFNIMDFPPEMSAPTDANTVNFWLAPHNDYKQPMDSIIQHNDIIVVSFFNKAVAVFDIQSEKEIDAIYNYQIINTKNNKQ